ncbi:MAG: PhnD/SsuA/transferrin family substrate-binding protein [Deltaproteobacteria bacterium]|nr:PhnD/SsuA/transferrin family substrate-binding protein [Deltaproteobacteria bacterium]
MRLALAFLTLFVSVDSKPIKTLVYLAGGPGDTRAAEKPLKSFLSQWETAAAVPAGTLDGKYFPQKDATLEYAKSESPGLFMLPAVTYFENEKAWGLQPIAQVAVKGSPAETLYVVVKKGTVADLAALKGKTVTTNLLAEAKFADLVVLEDGRPLAKVAKLEYDRSPLAALKKVREGAAAGVLLDEAQWAGLEKLPFAAELTLLAKTKPVPRPVVAVGKGVDKATAAKLKDGLLKLGSSPDAQPTLQQFSVDGIVAADEALLAESRKRFGAKK